MDELIENFIEGLMAVGEQYPELYEDEVRSLIFDLLDEGFAENTDADPVELPETLGLSSEEADTELRDVLAAFLGSAAEVALDEGYELPDERRQLLSADELDDFVGTWFE